MAETNKPEPENQRQAHAPRPVCPNCHLPIREGASEISYEGHFYHSRCAPSPSSAGDKDDPYRGTTPITI